MSNKRVAKVLIMSDCLFMAIAQAYLVFWSVCQLNKNSVYKD